jgi:effector-binding domain-containing protein
MAKRQALGSANSFFISLGKRKIMAEMDNNSAGALEVKPVQWQERTYVADREEVVMTELPKEFMEKLPRTSQYIKDQQMEMNGPPAGLYYTWDLVRDRTDLAVAIPVREVKNLSGRYAAITVGTSNAIVVDYYGPYSNLRAAYSALEKYEKEHKVKVKWPAIEEYVTDPHAEKDPNKWLTKVYFLTE